MSNERAPRDVGAKALLSHAALPAARPLWARIGVPPAVFAMSRPATSLLIVRQASMLQGFHYLVEDSAGMPMGDIQWPMLAQARNARLRWHEQAAEGAIRLNCRGEAWRMEFEYLNRAWSNDVRYLLCGPGVPAVAEWRVPKGRVVRGEMRLVRPRALQLVRRWSWLRARFVLLDGATEVGRIHEPHFISRSRTLHAELPADLALPVRMLLIYLSLQMLGVNG